MKFQLNYSFLPELQTPVNINFKLSEDRHFWQNKKAQQAIQKVDFSLLWQDYILMTRLDL